MARRLRKKTTVAAQPAASFFLSKQSSTKKPAQNPVIDSVMQLQRTIGNRAVSGLLHSGALQTKLAISQPGDKYEREADTVAQRVVSMPESTVQRATDDKKKEIQKTPLVSGITPLVQSAVDEKKELQRAPIDEDKKGQAIQRTVISDEKKKEQGVQLKVEEDKKEDTLQKKIGSGNSVSMSNNNSGHLESAINSSKGGGQPLSEKDRSYFEPRFGTSFDGVRLHTDSQAAQVSSDLNAQAFTVGKDVFFGAGKFDTGSSAGKMLVAHELTHVVQQSKDNTPARMSCMLQPDNTKTSVKVDKSTGKRKNVDSEKETRQPKRQLIDFHLKIQKPVIDRSKSIDEISRQFYDIPIKLIPPNTSIPSGPILTIGDYGCSIRRYGLADADFSLSFSLDRSAIRSTKRQFMSSLFTTECWADHVVVWAYLRQKIYIPNDFAKHPCTKNTDFRQQEKETLEHERLHVADNEQAANEIKKKVIQ